MPLLSKTHLKATERHLPYGIAQCYLPPGTDERAPSQLQSDRLAGTLFTYPGLIESGVDIDG